MNKTTWLLAACVALAGCDKKQNTDGASGKATEKPGTTEPTPPQTGPVTLNASGATFQKAFQEVAIEGFMKANPNIKVNYGAGGSGKGRQDFGDQVVDFACTDAPYKDADVGKVKGGDFYYIPNVLGAITVSYNVDGVDKLQLSPQTVAKIFQREIKSWDDKAIAADNPGVKLPKSAIVVAHRSDGSGTTENFTKFLAGAAGDAWKLKSGPTVEQRSHGSHICGAVPLQSNTCTCAPSKLPPASMHLCPPESRAVRRRPTSGCACRCAIGP